MKKKKNTTEENELKKMRNQGVTKSHLQLIVHLKDFT